MSQKGFKTISVRDETDEKINLLSKKYKINKSEIVKRSITLFETGMEQCNSNQK